MSKVGVAEDSMENRCEENFSRRRESNLGPQCLFASSLPLHLNRIKTVYTTSNASNSFFLFRKATKAKNFESSDIAWPPM